MTRLNKEFRCKQYLDLIAALTQGDQNISEGERNRYLAIAEIIAFEDDRFTALEAFQLSENIEIATQDLPLGPVAIDPSELATVVFNKDLARLSLMLCEFFYDAKTKYYVSGPNAQRLDVTTIKCG